MKKPNFFILGAPKCGTTSLASWLAEHPAIYMSPYKEPHHYSSDFSYGDYSDRDAYLSLFENANESHLAVGEASVWYLYSKKAVLEIEADVTDAKYIVMLRNPIEMAPSLHQQIFFTGDENIKSFEQSWAAQSDRKNGVRIPRPCRESSFLLYGEACSLGSQLEQLLVNVPCERVLAILLDDIKADPRKVWLDILSFLGVPDDERADFSVVNKARKRRFRSLMHINRIYSHSLQKINVRPLGFGISKYLDKLNVHESPYSELSLKMKQELVEYFESDIRLLEKRLNRNLDHWLL